MSRKRVAAACRRSSLPFTFTEAGEPLVRGVRVDVIVSRFRAGESIGVLGYDYNIPCDEIIEALRCGTR